MTVDYVHGYSQRESTRLEDQADCLTNLLHHDSTFTAMIEGIRERVTGQGIIDQSTFEQGIGDLYKTCEPNGVFCYTFFRGSGTNP